MGDKNPICTLGDYSKPSHEGYKNTIELLVGSNVVPLRSDTIQLVQNGCSFHGLQSEDPNQHLKDFLKHTHLTLMVKIGKERSCIYFNFPFTIKLAIGLNIFQQDPSPHGRILLHISLLNFFHREGLPLAPKSCALLEDLALYDNESWNDPRDFTKLVKAIALPQDVPSISDCCLIELENQVQCLMEAHLAPTQPTQVNKVTTSCEIYSGPHDTQYCMEDPEQAFVDYASSRIDEARGKWYTFKPEQNKLGDTYNPSWKSHSNLK
ncbi:hypothetical protein Tco_1166843 [Tanacetum coccineum]